MIYTTSTDIINGLVLASGTDGIKEE